MDTHTKTVEPNEYDDSPELGVTLRAVKSATTIDAGLAAFRQGIANELTKFVGDPIARAQNDAELENSPTPGIATLMPEQVAGLAQLLEALQSDNDVWADALIENTPMADNATERQTASRAALA